MSISKMIAKTQAQARSLQIIAAMGCHNNVYFWRLYHEDTGAILLPTE